MGRKKLTKLDALRAKVWAHTCAWQAGADEAKKASGYVLFKLANNFRQKTGSDSLLDTGFWSRCLRGKKGVSPKLVAELGNEKLWPLSFSAYHFGPPIPCGPADEGYYECAPLWAILRNQPEKLPKLWGEIRNDCWIAWSPFMAEYSSDGQAIDTWLGPHRGIFKNQMSLYIFFQEYLNNLEDLEPLFGLAVVLSFWQLRGDNQIALKWRFSPEYLKRIEDGLALFDVGLQDLAEATREHGFQLHLEYEPEPEYETGHFGIRPMPSKRSGVVTEEG